MKKLSIISPIFALLFAVPAMGQELHKDITVEQQVNPSRRDAARIGVLPTVSLSPVKAAELTYSNKVVTTNVPNTFTTLDPVSWGESLFTSPYRGYLDLGIGGPLMTGDVSAGYRILDRDKTRMSLWGQYNGDIYKRSSTTWHDHTASLGLDVNHTVGNNARLSAGVDYTYGFHDMPAWEEGRFSQSTSRINVNVGLDGRNSGLDYSAALRYSHFGFYNPHIPGLTLPDQGVNPSIPVVDPYNGYLPVRQNLMGVSLGASLETSQVSRLGVEVNGDFLATGKHYEAIAPFADDNISSVRSRTTGLVTATPYYELQSAAATLRLGADVDFAINSGKTIRVAPDVTLAWHGTQIFGIEVRAHGGSTLNTLASLYDVTPYMNGSVAYRASHMPYVLDARMVFGPFFGTTVELFGGYAKADDYLMPVAGDIYPAGAAWQSLDIKGYRYGARIGYDNGKNIAFRASYEGAPSKYDKAWYDNHDRARHVIDAELKIRPVSRLLLTIGYEMRAGRACYAFDEDFTVNIAGHDVYEPQRVSLGAVSNLTFGAGFTATERLTLFLRGENLLGRKAMYLGFRPMQNINGMIGAALKF